MTSRMAMFPLGSVLMPTMLLPLHVFEDRYRRLVDDVLASEPAEFGVVLIERGSEVGGGDVRTSVGCTARILEASQAPDGRWALLCVGERRIRVEEWLADDPYPIASVEAWPDRPSADPTDLVHRCDELVVTVRRVAALASELGAPGLVEPLDLSDDPVERTYQLAVLSPLGALDRLDLLGAADPDERAQRLAGHLEHQETLIRAQLSFGSE